jgi:hypothetical protein
VGTGVSDDNANCPEVNENAPNVEKLSFLSQASFSGMADVDFTVVVSGLPRSGTSVMMQMLTAGGIPVATDKCRRADADNPCGYFELEAVKAIARDASFLDGCRGKAVKIIHALLPHIKVDREYRVVFMRRHLDEVLASQR